MLNTGNVSKYEKKLSKKTGFLLVALQKTPSLIGAECQGVGTTPLHANERGQTVRFVAVIEPPVYWGISIWSLLTGLEPLSLGKFARRSLTARRSLVL